MAHKSSLSLSNKKTESLRDTRILEVQSGKNAVRRISVPVYIKEPSTYVFYIGRIEPYER